MSCRVSHGFTLTKWLFSSHFRPFLKKASFWGSRDNRKKMAHAWIQTIITKFNQVKVVQIIDTICSLNIILMKRWSTFLHCRMVNKFFSLFVSLVPISLLFRVVVMCCCCCCFWCCCCCCLQKINICLTVASLSWNEFQVHFVISLLLMAL